MKSTSRALLLIAIALMLAPLAAADTGRRKAAAPPTSTTPTAKSFGVNALEYYMTDDGIAYIRPGLKIKVNSITIGTDRKPVVDLTLTDDSDQPVDRLGKTTPGAISLSFILAWYDPATRQYTSYTTRSVTTPANSPRPGAKAIQAGADAGGTTTDLATGSVKYAFGTALPAGFDQTKTHTLGIYATRNLTTQIGKNYYFNVEFDFRPDGVKVTDKWDKINVGTAATQSTWTSCASCHDPLATTGGLGAHGGSRRDPKLCALCHQPQTVDPDTGNTVDFKVMIHRIHNGPNLPSVLAGTPYTIWGNAQSIHDFSHTTYPQDVRNCDTCHEGALKPTQSDVWYTKPSREACGSCHDDINWVTGANHPAGAQANDNACASCHKPDGDEFGASIKGAHLLNANSTQLKGITATIVSVSDVAVGKKPTVVFKLTNTDGTAIDGGKLATFSPIQAGNTGSYSWYKRDNAIGKSIFNATAGTTTYTFADAIPAGSTGTWTFSADIRRNTTLKRADGKADIAYQESTINPIKYMSLTAGKAAEPRRTVVTLAQCNACHDRLSLHGGQRNTTEECVICHNPVESDTARRPANAGAPESISFQRMIHRIHTGEELTQDFSIFGFGGTAINFNEVTFPGDRKNCSKCHAGNTYTLPVATSAASVNTPRDYFTPQGPGTAACLGCHDNKDAAAHAYLNSVTFPGATIPAEACATCHGTGKDWDAAKVHAR
jgi:OmcA/MtrC family decaheme c-type cytochrome